YPSKLDICSALAHVRFGQKRTLYFYSITSLACASSAGGEAEAAFATMTQQKVSAVQYGASVLFQVINDRLVELAARHRIPASYEWREAVIAGGLMSYNTNRAPSAGQIGRYVAEILKGAKPADLPVLQSSNFVFVINLKTAKALGLEIPAALLAQADEVIE